MNLQKNEVMKIDKELKGLKPIIKTWMDLIRKYSNRHKNEDALYWYNERATLSTLVGAIWKWDGTALEEFLSTKTKSQNKKSKRTKSGRTDLWFEWRDKQYIVEAKQISPSMHKSKKPIVDQLKESLEKACNDAVKFSFQDGNKQYVRIGITFLTPCLPKSYKDKDIKIEIKVQELKEALENGLKIKRDYHLFVWLFLDSTRKLYDNDKLYYYPGIVLAARIAQN
jgi:hypothetical protein